MNLLIIVLAVVTFVSTMIGGLVIFRFKKSLPYFFAFASGALIAVSFFDILPESLSLASSINFPSRYIMIAVVASFFVYSLVEKLFLTHQLDEECECSHGHGHEHIMGPIGAGSLILHSFLDGAAIGSAFQINASIGLVVALAVIFHDFTDGINTVVVMLKNKHRTKNSFIFLLFDAIAPVLGVALTSIIVFPQKVLAIILAVFVGEFLYIGATSLLPETHKYDAKKTALCILLGMLLIYVLTSFLKV